MQQARWDAAAAPHPLTWRQCLGNGKPLSCPLPPPRSPEALREAKAREEGRRDKETTAVAARPRGAPSSLLPACRKVDGARGRRCPPLGRGWGPG